MAKVLKYEYLRLTVINSKTEVIIPFKELIEALEKKTFRYFSSKPPLSV